MIRANPRLAGGDATTVDVEILFVDESPGGHGIRTVGVLDRNGAPVSGVTQPEGCPDSHYVILVDIPLTLLPLQFEGTDCGGNVTPPEANPAFLPPVGDPDDVVPSLPCAPLMTDCGRSNPACDEAVEHYNSVVSRFTRTCRRCRGLLEESLLHAGLAAFALSAAIFFTALAVLLAVMAIAAFIGGQGGAGALLLLVTGAVIAMAVAAWISFAKETAEADRLMQEHHRCNAEAEEIRREAAEAEQLADAVCCGCHTVIELEC